MLDKERQLKARIELSEEIMEWQEGKKDVILELATGCGKGGLSFKITNSVKHDKILAVFPQTPLKQNFINDLNELGFGHLEDKIELTCYASLKKYIGTEWDVIIYDEAHHLFSDARMKAASGIKAGKRALLSATLDDKVKAKLSNEFKMDTFSLGYEAAVSRGILPEVVNYVIKVKLDNKERIYDYTFKGEKTKVTAFQYYSNITGKIKYYGGIFANGEGPDWARNSMLRAGGDRIKFLGEVKEKKLLQILERLGDRRAIIFCSSKEQAHRLGGDDAVSSDNTKKVNKWIIEEFNSGAKNKLFAKSMLTEGMNLSNTSVCVVGSLGSKKLRGTQVRGRILRSVDEEPMMILVVVEGTVDERFLKESFGLDMNGNKVLSYY